VNAFLLDTSAFIKAARPELGLGKQAMHVMEDQDNEILLSTISIAEIAIKVSVGALIFTQEEIDKVLEDLQIKILEYRYAHAIRYLSLPAVDRRKGDHADPFDRMLIATALAEGLPIVTSDPHFKGYKGIEVIW
jgi:PIN domain nuclease of toxin-antitoxin system